MKFFTILIVAALAIAASASDEYNMDDMDLGAMIQDDAQRKAVVDCLLDKAPCGDLQKFRDIIPKLIETKCDQCTPPQKEKYELVYGILKEKYPEDFNAIMSKYGSKPQ